MSTVDVINIAADRQKFMTLTGEVSRQRVRRSAVPGIWHTGDFDPPFRGVRDNARTSLMARWKARMRLPIRRN